MPRKKTKQMRQKELDSVFFLKLVLYLILGSIWFRIDTGGLVIPLPLGLTFGVLLASHDRFRIDRKIEFALLLLSAFLAFWLPMGVNIML